MERNDFYKDSYHRGSVCSDFLMIPPKKRTPQYKMKFLNSLSQGVNMLRFFENVNQFHNLKNQKNIARLINQRGSTSAGMSVVSYSQHSIIRPILFRSQGVSFVRNIHSLPVFGNQRTFGIGQHTTIINQ